MSNYITTHDKAGKAIFTPAVPPAHHHNFIGEGPSAAPIATLWSGHTLPPTIPSSESDIQTYAADRVAGNAPGTIAPPGGSTVAVIDMSAGSESPMHRTMTLDFDYILAGEVELSLDSGEVRVLKAGDSVVMRATAHKWRNVTPNEGQVKMLCFAQTLKEEKVKVGDLELGTDWAL